MTKQRTETQMLDEIENANGGQGPDPIATFDGPALTTILAALRDRNQAQARIDAAVAQARAEGASWTAIGAMLGVSRQAALKRYGTGSAAFGDYLRAQARRDDPIGDLARDFVASGSRARTPEGVLRHIREHRAARVVEEVLDRAVSEFLEASA